ncbi:SAM-dependent methyltransferase [Methylacidiphilum kamchatkense Kam1]|uniref:SAM-dependent methyltransferase n=1 Tax=Methylacidiphilum kamchatkense Kam1 TaxID=1202785 RepID=A0A0C1RJG1_9BACT|nr:class I SAM-dependent methyltransferase [Methylacidiphilum kamchatkense]KIE58212.1 SAM-dependent methyltransferase [Methylacidiphilum kamchatkense Kam1]QDQ42080.1 ubiquinone/menaquinone biosynthesis C-methylase UbiE [Methylacidiphilum kamchatkense Kam1]
MLKNTFALDFNSSTLFNFNFLSDIRIFHIIKSAIDLSIFRILNSHAMTVRDITEKLGASQRGVIFFLDSLTALGLLEKENHLYSLSALSKNLFIEESPDYIGNFFIDSFLNKNWEALTTAILKGGLSETVDDKTKAEEFFPKLINFLHIFHRNPAIKAAETIGAGRTSNGLQVLDIGCGSAVWSIAVALADRNSKVTAVDYPGVLEYTRNYVQRYGLLDRYEFLAGNIDEIDFPHNNFNLVIFGHILHMEGENKSRQLFKKIAKVIASDGRIAILEFLPNRQRTEPLEAVLFGLQMLLYTKEGGVYSREEYEDWLKDAGFSKFAYHDIGYHSPLLLASK